MQYFFSGSDIEFILTEKAEVSFTRHSHATKYSAGLVLTGSAEIVLNDRMTICKKGTLFIIPVLTVHELYVKDASSKILTMCVDSKIVDTITDGSPHQELIEQIRAKCVAVVSAVVSNALPDAIRHIAEQFIQAFNLMTSIHTSHKSSLEKMPKKIKHAIQIIMTESEKNLKLDTLAQKISINKFYLIRKFSSILGISPHTFILQNRISKSRKLLQKGKTVAETAVLAGFYDQSHFDHCFKNATGLAPSEYAKKCK